MQSGAKQETDNSLVLSFLAVRRAIGIVGILLPFALILGGVASDTGLETSISAFYHTNMRDVFVGAMCAVGVFLLSYNGYDRKPGEWLSDGVVARIAGVSAIGIVLAPIGDPTPSDTIIPSLLNVPKPSEFVHYPSALVFYLALGVFSLFLFTKTDPTTPMTPRKRLENRIYRICGILIFAALAGLVAILLIPDAWEDRLDAYFVFFWLEAIGVWAFGVSWMVKGKTLGAVARLPAMLGKSPPKT